MGTPRYRIVLEKHPPAEEIDLVRAGLYAFNIPFTGPDNFQPLVLFVRGGKGRVVGGLLGQTFWGWLHIDTLWIDEPQRGLGFGRDLLKAAELEAVQRGCQGVFLDTLSVQAPGFYEKHGYERFGMLPDFVAGHTRLYYAKRLDTEIRSSS